MKRRKPRSSASRAKANVRATAVLHRLKHQWANASPTQQRKLEKRITKILNIF